MLKKFSVENFEGFKDKVTLDFSSPSNYAFHQEAISNNCITKGILYGFNGSGKSSLGYAVFDIVCHLTDKNRQKDNYNCYLNLDSEKTFAEFEYVFLFNESEVRYLYKKSDVQTLLEEHLYIDGNEVIAYNFVKNEGITILKGSETLMPSITKEDPISRVKYVASNAILADNKENAAFRSFIDFVDRMLLFYSLDTRGYQGFMNGSKRVAEGIIEAGKLSDFQQLLEENEMFYKLKEVEINGRKEINCCFDRGEVNFFEIASTGTKSLSLFYYWYIQMQKMSFVFIDEFDAFYHYELAESVVKRLVAMDKTQIFVTTHNTDLLSNDLLRPDCYFILKDNKIFSLADATEKELRQAHNLQKMYKAGAFDGK